MVAIRYSQATLLQEVAVVVASIPQVAQVAQVVVVVAD
jgi:hypothetical protein